MTTTFLPATHIPVSVKAQFSGRSRSSFYYKHKQHQKDQESVELLRSIHIEMPEYGHRRLAMATGMNKKKVLRLMHVSDIKPKTRRKKQSKNQYSRIKTSLPNNIKGVVLDAPNQVWSGDFTYLRFKGKTYYFATVIDSYTREILGWHISGTHSVALVLEALQMALKRRKASPMFFHSDHGSEYLSEQYTNVLAANGITPSNSQKGKPWQNGAQESLYGKFKFEFGDPNRFPYYESFFEALAIQVRSYNQKRIHTSLRMPPSVFYDRYMERQTKQQEQEQNQTKNNP